MATSCNGDSVDNIVNLLQKTEVRLLNIVSFKSRGLKLDNAEDAKEIVEAIRNSPDVQVLELGGNTIGVNAAKAIADALKDRPELQRCLWADMFTGRLLSETPLSLRSLGDAIIMAKARLVEIDLSDNAFGPNGINACIKLLKSEAAYSLEVLKFNNNGLGIGGKILAETLIECHGLSCASGRPLALKVFIAGRNRLENPGAKALASAFKTIGTLEEIQMPQNGINYQGITALAEAVKNSPNLRHLNLNDNTFSVKGAVAMADAIREIDSLEIINFGDCLVRTEGASAIGESLQHSNPNLKKLVLSFGEVQLDGAIRVCEGVIGKENLESLDLNGNQFGEDGVEEVREIAKEMGYLEALESLSDDEGVESDEDDDNESGSEAEEESDEAEESNSHADTNLEYRNGVENHILRNGASTTVTAADFPDKVSVVALLALNDAKRKELVLASVNDLGTETEAYIDACMKMAGLLESYHNTDRPRLERAVFDCTNVYLQEAFKTCPDRPMRAVDRLLIRLGLLKSEDKAVKAVTNPRPLLYVLKDALAQSYYPHTTKKMVRAMLAKTSKVWDRNIDLQNQLLKLLY